MPRFEPKDIESEILISSYQAIWDGGNLLKLLRGI